MRASRLVIPMVILGSLAAGCGGEDAPPPPSSQPTGAAAPAAPAVPAVLPAGVTEAMFVEGQQIFTSQGICFTCHAMDGSGTALGPSMRDDDWMWIDTSQDLLTQIETIVRTGIAVPQEYPGPMPAMGGVQLSDDQVRAVAGYVAALSQVS